MLYLRITVRCHVYMACQCHVTSLTLPGFTTRTCHVLQGDDVERSAAHARDKSRDLSNSFVDQCHVTTVMLLMELGVRWRFTEQWNVKKVRRRVKLCISRTLHTLCTTIKEPSILLICFRLAILTLVACPQWRLNKQIKFCKRTDIFNNIASNFCTNEPEIYSDTCFLTI